MNILSDKHYKQYDSLSRYQYFPIYWNELDGTYVSGTTANLNNTTASITHTVADGDTLDTLALYYYGNPTYYWIIADFNRIKDPFADLEAGSKIQIPTFSTITFEG